MGDALFLLRLRPARTTSVPARGAPRAPAGDAVNPAGTRQLLDDSITSVGARARRGMSAPSDNSQETAARRPSPRRSRLARRTPACANAPLCGNFESTVPSDFFALTAFFSSPPMSVANGSKTPDSRSLLATRWQRGRTCGSLKESFWALNQPCWQGAMFLLTPAEGRLAGQKEANVPRETWRRRTHRRHARFLDARAEPPVATASTRRESGRRRSAAQARSGRIFRATHLSPGRRGSRDRRRFAGSRAR